MIELLIILLCLAINAVLAGAEMAFVTVGRAHLRELARTGNRMAGRILSLRDNPERTLSVIQVGITLVGTIAAAVGGAEADELLDPYFRRWFGWGDLTIKVAGIVAVVIPYTYLSVVFGELVPKSIALRDPLKLVLASGRWLIFFERVLSPVVSVLEGSTKWVLGLVLRRSRPSAPMSTPETVELGDLSHQARQYVLNLVSLEKKKVRDVMLPWECVIFVQAEHSMAEVEEVIVASGHTRLPVKSGDRVIGVLNTKELLSLRKGGAQTWNEIVRAPVAVQETDSLLATLRLMQDGRSHLSVVYAGGTLRGIVTMEDIFEEIIGDIFDEDDDGAVKRILSTASKFRTAGSAIR